MARFIYSVCVVLLLPVALIYLLWRARKQPEYLQHWRERFGFFGDLSHRVNESLIWLHAVSVGETRAAQPLIAALRERFPEHHILMTHMTPTGRATSQELFGDSITSCYLPYDTPWAMRHFLRHLSPRFGLVMETELWPNLVAACKKRDVPLMLVNARLSEKSAAGYAKLPALAKETLQGLRAIAAQSHGDADRLTALGAHSASVVGNIKFDIDAPENQIASGKNLRAQIGQRKVFLAASTREGEEVLLLDAWTKCSPIPTPTLPLKGRELKRSPVGADVESRLSTAEPLRRHEAVLRETPASPPLLIIVPRHPQRFNDVAALIQAKGLRMQRRSDNAAIDAHTEVLLGDSMGEMFAWHTLADIAFIGGSLLDFGSQNLIEACAVGTPVLLGPSTYNFAEAAFEAQACGAALAIVDADDLVQKALALINDALACSRMSEAGLRFAQQHRGATARTMELIVRAIA